MLAQCRGLAVSAVPSGLWEGEGEGFVTREMKTGSLYRVFFRDILKGGNIGLRSSFHQNFEETKGYSPGVFFPGSEKCVEKSNPSESKRKEKLNGTCFSCIVHVSREL